MNIEIKELNGGYTAIFNGRLDTPAAVKAQQDITPLLENADKEIVLDCTNLEYISSSGLRLFLTLRKETSTKGGKVIIKNINDEIVFSREGDVIWQCSNCGHIVIGKKAPKICPVCNHPQSYFQIEARNY